MDDNSTDIEPKLDLSPVLESTPLEPVAIEPTPIVDLPEPIPETIPSPAPELLPNPIPQLLLDPVQPSEPAQPEHPVPQPIPVPEQNPQPQPQPQIIISDLTDTQLKEASALWAKKNQRQLSQKGVQARQAVAKKNLADITAFIVTHSPASNRTIARALNLPPRRVSHYIQILTKNGTVKATGWAQSRQYFKK